MSYVSRGGLKLRHALDTFRIDATGLTCADLGASTGGFTDCLLQAGAARVHAVDTAYGQFAWKLRNDPRVVMMERTNARIFPESMSGNAAARLEKLMVTTPTLLSPISVGRRSGCFCRRPCRG